MIRYIAIGWPCASILTTCAWTLTVSHIKRRGRRS